ncbi:MAG: UDP-N-acetylglucosamine--N-acetylmuramyl-(pentapeptide) pyrophosphoryl-undecaprenol N-acetylglucosamine transferase [Bacteriovoracaceae bacterium]|nr:UDP-N-acetylglucosamine--N-acetylmuramyl-(pentapeptide) pyrophosphoryl-undecaprenol N-acetylglucosamine transferase [Bacteriovoracaceae bacterium]
MKRYAVLVAGGTGGHINAAIALGERLLKKDFEIFYLSGQRPLDFKLFANRPVRHLGSWPLRTSNPLKLINAMIRNIFVFFSILIFFIKKRPSFVVGAGGYVCGPTLLAAKILGVPIYIFEQNAVLGLTNKLLAKISNIIFTHFKNTKGIPEGLLRKVKVVGNPTRSAIQFKKPAPLDSTLKVLVFGGSLGATQINEVIWDIVQLDYMKPISIIHQSGRDEEMKLKIGKNVEYIQKKYLDNIEEQYNWCDVLVARAGASTISELRIVRKPAFIIPFPQATDNHQWWNAIQYKEETDYDVEIVDPKLPKLEIAKRLAAFLALGQSHSLKTSQLIPLAVDSSEVALREIFSNAGIIQKN